jgi:hypothetical protein
VIKSAEEKKAWKQEREKPRRPLCRCSTGCPHRGAKACAHRCQAMHSQRPKYGQRIFFTPTYSLKTAMSSAKPCNHNVLTYGRRIFSTPTYSLKTAMSSAFERPQQHTHTNTHTNRVYLIRIPHETGVFNLRHANFISFSWGMPLFNLFLNVAC